VNDRFAAIFTRSNQPDYGIVGIGVGVKLRVVAEISEIGLVREIHRDFRFVGDRMHDISSFLYTK
jgi:hypothetical protein